MDVRTAVQHSRSAHKEHYDKQVCSACSKDMLMATITIDGASIHYESFGSGPALVLTPGGRMEKEVLRPLARALADRCHVVTWDRRNTGASDLYLGGERSELEVWADDLAELVRQLGIAPAYLGGGSAGCRVTLAAAVRHPTVVRGLLLFQASGGPYTAQNLGYQYHVPYVQAAHRGGMAAVAETPHFAERIEKNPAARGQLLAADPNEFIRRCVAGTKRSTTSQRCRSSAVQGTTSAPSGFLRSCSMGTTTAIPERYRTRWPLSCPT